jgi:hypothetical protein
MAALAAKRIPATDRGLTNGAASKNMMFSGTPDTIVDKKVSLQSLKQCQAPGMIRIMRSVMSS